MDSRPGPGSIAVGSASGMATCTEIALVAMRANADCSDWEVDTRALDRPAAYVHRTAHKKAAALFIKKKRKTCIACAARASSLCPHSSRDRAALHSAAEAAQAPR